MTEWEICELFGVIAPTVRAGIKALCKSGVLKECGIERQLYNLYSYSLLIADTSQCLSVKRFFNIVFCSL